MARKKVKKTRGARPVSAVHKHTMLKCQVRLSAARGGIRVQVIAAPDTPPFAGVKIWVGDDPERMVTLKGGAHAETVLNPDPDEDFKIEISYGAGKKNSVQIGYEHRRPFGFKAVVLFNQAKVNLIGSVPRIR